MGTGAKRQSSSTIKKTKIASAGEDVMKWEHLRTVGGKVN
jgi:hypothetical protein